MDTYGHAGFGHVVDEAIPVLDATSDQMVARPRMRSGFRERQPWQLVDIPIVDCFTPLVALVEQLEVGKTYHRHEVIAVILVAQPRHVVGVAIRLAGAFVGRFVYAEPTHRPQWLLVARPPDDQAAVGDRQV